MSFRIVKEKLLYVIGIPRKYASDDTLRSRDFLGQFGQADRIVINYNPKDVYEGQVAVYVHYKNPVNVAIALKVSQLRISTRRFNSNLSFVIVSERTSDEQRSLFEVLVWHK